MPKYVKVLLGGVCFSELLGKNKCDKEHARVSKYCAVALGEIRTLSSMYTTIFTPTLGNMKVMVSLMLWIATLPLAQPRSDDSINVHIILPFNF